MAIEMDWDFINKLQESAKSGGTSTGESIYLKMSPGIHKVRIVPAGNDVEKIPFRKITQHNWTGADKIPIFTMCWNYIYNNPEKVAMPLYREQKLVKADIELYKQHGCPMCRALDVLDRAGMAKEAKQPLFPRDSYIWNVLLRPTDPNDRTGGKLFVWNTSTKIWTSVINTLREMKANNLDVLHTENGFDWIIQAEGENLQRRYNVNCLPAPKPMNLGVDQKPHNLVEVANLSFRNYQDTIDTLKQKYGKVFMTLGYEVPGDKTNGVFNKPVETHIPQQVAQVFEEAKPVVTDGVYTKNGTLYNAETNEPLF